MKFSSKIASLSGRFPTVRVITNHLKERLRYGYKKGFSRSTRSCNQKLKFMQAIFCCRIMDFISSKHTIINIDEATFTKNVQQHYSWLPRGKDSLIINLKWRGSLSVVFALYDDGNWIWMFTKSTITSQRFWWFLMILTIYTEDVLGKSIESVKITSDNAQIHLAKRTQIIINYLGLNMHMLPPYSPQLALVEWVFGMTKKIISSLKPRSEVDF